MLHMLRIIQPFTKHIQTPIKYHQRFFRSTPVNGWLQKRLGRNASSAEKEAFYKKKDKISDAYQLIYRAPMETYMTFAMHTSTITAAIVSLAAVFQYATNVPLSTPINDTKLVMNAEDIYYYAVGFVAINAILRFVVAKCPIRIYKSGKSYKSVHFAQLPGLASQNSFNRGEVKKVNYFFNPWNNASYKMGTKTCLIFEDYFKTPSEFNHLFDIGEMSKN